jgi:4-amino-4-deoxy-L-arabinose transferase-like glycosyltransferase
VHNRRTEFLSYAALLLLGSLAFVHLMALPAFEDEGSQLRWISRMIQAGEWLQPFGDGKPLEAWAITPLVWLGIPDLPAARGLHVLSGMLAVLLTYGLALELGDRAAAFVSGVLLAVCPFLVYLQRLALADVFLCAGGSWVLLSVIRFIRSPMGTHAIGLACSLVLAAFCKFPLGFLFLAAMPLAMLCMPTETRRSLLHPPALAKLIAAYVPVALLVMLVAAVALVRVRKGFFPGFGLQHVLGIGLGRYSDIAQTIGIAPPNLLTELSAQLSWPVIVLGCIGMSAAVIVGDWRRRWLVAVGLLPLFAIGLASFWFSRYVLFTLPPLIIAAVSGWRSLMLRAGSFKSPGEWGVLALCAALMGQQSLQIIVDPVAARWSPLDRFQYFEGWTSGYGYPEAAKFLLTTSVVPAMVYSLDGHSAYQLLTYLPKDWRSRVRPVIYGPDGSELRDEDARWHNLFSRTPVWIVVPESLLTDYLESSFGQVNSRHIDLRQVAMFDKPGMRTRLGLYEARARLAATPPE